MPKPVILCIDDEPHVLNAVERDLKAYYQKDYRIIKAASGEEALETLRELKKRNDAVALLLCDERMPSMTGTQFIAQTRTIYPDARKVLLTAYADTEAAIASINIAGLDYYLMKPWDPPEERLYPVLDDLLSDWRANYIPPYEGIRVVGNLWSPTSHEAKNFLTSNQIPYQWLDIEADRDTADMIDDITDGEIQLPVILFPDGETLIQPDTRTLAEKIGLHTEPLRPFYDLIIIGGGPAGLGAAVYGGSEGFRTIMIEKHAPGGQAGGSSRIENYLGFPNGISGADLARRATTQALRFDVELLSPIQAESVRVDDPYKYVRLEDGTELCCMAVLIATGVSTRQLNIPGIETLNGAGVYYGATSAEAALYKGQHVVIVGGGNSAGQGAVFCSRFASKVSIVAHSSELTKGMSQYLVDQVAEHDNIEVLTRSSVIEVRGSDHLEQLVIKNNDSGDAQTVDASAMFLFIGATPHTEMVAGVVERNRAGFIRTGQDLAGDPRYREFWPLKRQPFLLETSVQGIFAAGDVRQGSVKRVASAVGEGAIAVSLVRQYLRTV